MALASMGTKRVATRIIRRFGYRRVLAVNTVLRGVQIAGFALMTPNQPLWLRIVQLAVFGAFNSMQFTCMNTVTLKDMTPQRASSGSTMLSMVQMLAMSLGVTVAAALVATFEALYSPASTAHALQAFRAAFVCIGFVTVCSAWIVWQLRPDAPRLSQAATPQSHPPRHHQRQRHPKPPRQRKTAMRDRSSAP